MGILGKIWGGLKWIVSAPFVALNNILNAAANATEKLRENVDELLGFKKKPPTEKIRAALRKQWLELEPHEKEIAGVEYEGEIYYETPK
jgi:hypothetical protein